jgi:hypothetical protein
LINTYDIHIHVIHVSIVSLFPPKCQFDAKQ